jgi:adenylate cyclase
MSSFFQRKASLSLTFQYAITIMLLVLVGMTMLILPILYNQAKQYDQFMQDFGSIISQQLASAAVEPLFTEQVMDLEILINNFSKDKHIVSAAIFNNNHEKIVSRGVLPNKQELVFHREFYKLGNTQRFDYQRTQVLAVHISPIRFKGVVGGYAVVVFSQDLFNEQFHEQLYQMLYSFIALIILTIGISFFLAQRLSKPIRNIVAATREIHEGKIDIILERRTDELGALIDAINNMSQGLIRKSQVESMLDKILTKDVKHKVMDQLDTVHMAGEHVDATVLFADIVGFTSISEKISPEEVQKLLNEYYGYFNACARFYFGTVDKYIGDCVMVVFGVPKADPKHQYNAIACAILMQKLAAGLNVRRQKEGQFPIELRIGINSGKMMAGLIGSDERMEYTVVGDAVNLASRLCNEATCAQVIIEDSLYQSVNVEHEITVESFKKIRVRGKEEPVTIYSVTAIAQTYQKVMDDLIEDMLSRKRVI